jgi:hypothetical protein
MLAIHGFDACGLEVSRTAVATATKYAGTELLNPTAQNFSAGPSLPNVKQGKVKFVLGDPFKRDWESECSEREIEGFDLIYDYTASTVQDEGRTLSLATFSFSAHSHQTCEKDGHDECSSCCPLQG